MAKTQNTQPSGSNRPHGTVVKTQNTQPSGSNRPYCTVVKTQNTQPSGSNRPHGTMVKTQNTQLSGANRPHVTVVNRGSESAPHFNMSLLSWVRALTEAKEKGMRHAPIACEWDHPSSEWARGWGPYKKGAFFCKGPPPGPLRRG